MDETLDPLKSRNFFTNFDGPVINSSLADEEGVKDCFVLNANNTVQTSFALLHPVISVCCLRRRIQERPKRLE